MGYGEVGGNQSVHWRIVHEDSDGAPKRLNRHEKDGTPEPDTIKFGHDVEGHDSIRYEQIGNKQTPFGDPRPQYFRVRLRYQSEAEAEAARQQARVVTVNGTAFLVLDVLAINRKNPKGDPPAEVRIDW
jgi:hypothetical protein